MHDHLVQSKVVSPPRVRVSVVVPVYNAMPYLDALLASLAQQDFGSDNYEVIIVNDGSSDGGSDLIDQYAAKFSNFTAIHQPNSGWPGGPRNRGIEKSSGDYLFFADSDDILALNALSEMVGFAQEHDSDIVIPQMTGIDGRNVSQALFKKTRLDLPIEDAFRTLGPIKLYKRSLIENPSIRFPEGVVRLEDGIFNADAYLRAKRISVLAGKDLYFVRARSDGNNISVRAFIPEGYTQSVAEICRKVNASELSQRTKEEVVLGTFRRKCLKFYHNGRFNKYTEERRAEWIRVHRIFIGEFISPAMEERLPKPFKEYSRLVRGNRVQDLLALGAEFEARRLEATLESAIWSSKGLSVTLVTHTGGEKLPRQLVAELRGRSGEGVSCLPLIAADGPSVAHAEAQQRYVGHLSYIALEQLLVGVYDLHLVQGDWKARRETRVEAGKLERETKSVLGVHLYRTKYGNASIHKTGITGSR